MLAQEVQVFSLLGPVDLQATAKGRDADLSILDPSESAVVVMSLGVVTGTTPTLAVKLQESDIAVRGAAYVVAGAVDNKLRAGATTTVKLGAKFTQSGARSIKNVYLYLTNPGTITAGKIVTLDIMGDSTGTPDGTSIGTSGSVLCSAVPVAGGWVKFAFEAPIDLADATVYHFVLSGDYTASTSNYIGWASGTVASAGNQSTFDDTVWTAVATESFRFWAEQYSFADITGAAFTGKTSGPSIHRLGVDLTAAKSVIRPVMTVGGSSPHFNMSLVLLARGRNQPVAAQA